jgi:hypothetical protein
MMECGAPKQPGPRGFRNPGQVLLGLAALLLLAYGWLAASFLHHAGWMAGFRAEGWPVAMGWSIPVFVGLALWLPGGAVPALLLLERHLGKRPALRRRWIACGLLVLAFWEWSIWNLRHNPWQSGMEQGRGDLEAEIGLDHLALACREAHRQLSKPPGEFIICRDPGRPPLPPAIDRLRPTHLSVLPDQLRIELFGGFDHYGYALEHDAAGRRWILKWYTEAGTEDRPLAVVPEKR